MKTVVGLYEDINDARAAIEELISAGFDRSDVSLLASNRWTDDEIGVATVNADQMGSDVATGIATGGALGGLGGVLLGLGALAIPGLGPIIAAGPLVAGLAGAGIGAAVGGLVGALVNWGIPPDEADVYAESVRRGGILVGLKTDEAHVEVAVAIMNRYGPIDIERRSAYWRATGWTGYEASSAAWSPDEVAADEIAYSDYLDYSTYAPAYREHYDSIYRNAGRQYIWYEPAYRYGYNLAHDKHYAGHEVWDDLELEARRGWEQTDYAVERAWNDIKDAVRSGWEEVKDAFDIDSDYGLFEPSFREHYDSVYAGRGFDYDWYSPGYRFGYGLAMDDRWNEYDSWDQLEVEARREWEQSETAFGRLWDDVKDAIRRGWEEVRDALDIETDYAALEPTYREHFLTRYRDSGHEYAWYEPAYRYGYMTALDDRYADYPVWDDDLESRIQRDWGTAYYESESPWEDVKDAVRRGWESVREAFDLEEDVDPLITDDRGYRRS